MNSLPPIPRGERRRLSTLRALNVLDSAPEAFSDAVVSAAASILNAPRAAISLVDASRQWFKGSCGLADEETPRDVSFCAHAISAGPEPFVIDDTWKDARFASNPLVVAPPYIRFYAGFPLIVNGEAIGALCVMDDRPRVLGAEERERLQELAQGTAAWLSLRPSEANRLRDPEAA